MRKTSATEAMNRLARSYPLLVDLAASDNALVDWLLSASNKASNELYRDIVLRIKTNGLRCDDVSIPPLSEGLMKRLVRRKNPFSHLKDREQHFFKIAFALNLAARLPGDWFPKTEAGFLNLYKCGGHFYWLSLREGSEAALDNALLGVNGLGLDLSNDDVFAIFRRCGEAAFDQSPEAAFFARFRGSPSLNREPLSIPEVLAVYGVKLAGHEDEFVDWQTKQEQSTRHVKKRYREWHWHGVPDLWPTWNSSNSCRR